MDRFSLRLSSYLNSIGRKARLRVEEFSKFAPIGTGRRDLAGRPADGPVRFFCAFLEAGESGARNACAPRRRCVRPLRERRTGRSARLAAPRHGLLRNGQPDGAPVAKMADRRLVATGDCLVNTRPDSPGRPTLDAISRQTAAFLSASL